MGGCGDVEMMHVLEGCWWCGRVLYMLPCPVRVYPGTHIQGGCTGFMHTATYW